MRDFNDDALQQRGRVLEDAFFAKRDRELVEAIKRKLTAEDNERALAAAIGINNEEAVKTIARLHTGVEVIAATALLPLVEVAWCDGDVSPQEQAAVLKGAAEMGVAEQSPLYQMLQGWLDRRPTREAVAAWKEYVRALCATLDVETKNKLKSGVLGRAEGVAQAAGGILGFGKKVSPSERACLDELAAAFSD
jgi:hypothetical protein